MRIEEAPDEFLLRVGRGTISSDQWKYNALPGNATPTDLMRIALGPELDHASLKSLPMVPLAEHNRPALPDLNATSGSLTMLKTGGVPEVGRNTEGVGNERDQVALSKDDLSSSVGMIEELHRFSGKVPGAPGVSCRSWMVADADTGSPLLWSRPGLVLQPASITKVVTALVVLELQKAQPESVRCATLFVERSPAFIYHVLDTCELAVCRKRFLSQKVTISTFAASFAAWTPEYGWNNGTNAKLKCVVSLDFKRCT